MKYYKATRAGYDEEKHIICETESIAQQAICKLFYDEIFYKEQFYENEFDKVKNAQIINDLVKNKQYEKASEFIITNCTIFIALEHRKKYFITEESTIKEIDNKIIPDKIFNDFFKKEIFK